MRWLIIVMLAAACGEVGGGRDDRGFFSSSRDTGVRAQVDAGPNVTVQIGFVIDGDTVVLNAGAAARSPDGRPLRDARVRLLGLDAPEIAHPEQGQPDPECWGDESHAALRDIAGGFTVKLIFAGNDLRDPNDRLLAYIELPNGKIANEEMITSGNAKHFGRFGHRDYDRYEMLEDQARASGNGVWTCP